MPEVHVQDTQTRFSSLEQALSNSRLNAHSFFKSMQAQSRSLAPANMASGKNSLKQKWTFTKLPLAKSHNNSGPDRTRRQVVLKIEDLPGRKEPCIEDLALPPAGCMTLAQCTLLKMDLAGSAWLSLIEPFPNDHETPGKGGNFQRECKGTSIVVRQGRRWGKKVTRLQKLKWILRCKWQTFRPLLEFTGKLLNLCLELTRLAVWFFHTVNAQVQKCATSNDWKPKDVTGLNRWHLLRFRLSPPLISPTYSHEIKKFGRKIRIRD